MCQKVSSDHSNTNSCITGVLRGTCIIASLALLVMGSVGAAGLLSSSTLAGATAGLAGGGFALGVAYILTLAKGDLLKSHQWAPLIASLLYTAIFVTLAALGATGILSTTQLGWGVTGTWLALHVAGNAAACHKCCTPNNSSTIPTL